MNGPTYRSPAGGLPPQGQLLSGRAVFKTSYAVIPAGVMTDIVTSALPHWTGARLWVLARPMSGFSQSFSQYAVELQPGGGSDTPEHHAGVEAVLFVTAGELVLDLDDDVHELASGAYVFIPPGAVWKIHNRSERPAHFQWIRKAYVEVEAVGMPVAIVSNERDVVPEPMPDTRGAWSTTRFVDPADMRHDMHVNIVTLKPGAVIPFMETHVMEHGIYVLEGKAVYRLNEDWVEVEAGDFLWLRAFCPQACYAGGPGDFRYLLYKDVNRHMPLAPV